MNRVFLSYRRSDSQHVADRLHDHLFARAGDEAIFKDIGDIPAGMDFREVLDQAIEDADVMLVVIGPDWLTVADEAGHRRLDDPGDFVRVEIESALERVPIVTPVLVMGAEMPGEDELPPSLAPLAYRQALHLRPDPDFATDVARLCEELGVPDGPAVPQQEGHGAPFLQMAIRRLPSFGFAMVTTAVGAAIAFGLGVRDSDPRLSIFGPLALLAVGGAWVVASARAAPARPGALASAWLLSTLGVLGTLFLGSAVVNPAMKPFLKPEVFQIRGTAVATPPGELACDARDSAECRPVAGVEAFVLYENAIVVTDSAGIFGFRVYSRDYELGNPITVRLTHPEFEARSVTDTLRGRVLDLARVELTRSLR